MKNSNKGITLVALVITIIVLLILVGVTLATISGESSIFQKAITARNETYVSQAKELADIVLSEAITDYYEGKYVSNNTSAKEASNMIEYIKAAIKDKQTEYSDFMDYEEGTFTIKGYEITGTIGEDGNITWAGKE